MKRSLLPFLLVGFFALACGKDKVNSGKSSETPQDVSALYKCSGLQVQVFYEDGAEPYTEGVAGRQIWDLFQENLEALFAGRKTEPSITVPKTLSEMTRLTSQNRTTWSVDQVRRLSKSSSTCGFQIFFLNGRAEENAGIIAFHITNTKIMAVFKDVIKGMTSGTVFAPRYVEQATIIHEMGHALGLVDNGLPMQTSHNDAAHGAHCKNPDCVMYWSNEGQSDMLAFVQKILATGSTVMFDQQCLEDSRKYKDY